MTYLPLGHVYFNLSLQVFVLKLNPSSGCLVNDPLLLSFTGFLVVFLPTILPLLLRSLCLLRCILLGLLRILLSVNSLDVELRNEFNLRFEIL